MGVTVDVGEDPRPGKHKLLDKTCATDTLIDAPELSKLATALATPVQQRVIMGAATTRGGDSISVPGSFASP
jgi:hypothetical protein